MPHYAVLFKPSAQQKHVNGKDRTVIVEIPDHTTSATDTILEFAEKCFLFFVPGADVQHQVSTPESVTNPPVSKRQPFTEDGLKGWVLLDDQRVSNG